MKSITLFKPLFATMCALSLAGTALADTNSASTNTSATGQAVNAGVQVTSYGAPQLPWTAASVDSDVHSNTVQSAPTMVGSTSSSAGGCPAVDGWSGAFVLANGGKTTAKEMPGCMLNLLTDRIGALRVVSNALGQTSFDGQSLMKLEAWCLYADYKTAIENSGLFKCKATRDEEARRAQAALDGQPTEPVTARKAVPGYMAGG